MSRVIADHVGNTSIREVASGYVDVHQQWNAVVKGQDSTVPLGPGSIIDYQAGSFPSLWSLSRIRPPCVVISLFEQRRLAFAQ